MTQNQQPNAEPKVVEFTPELMMKMLGQLLTAQSETSAVQRALLERELAKDEAIRLKDEAARIKIDRDRRQLLEQMQIQQVNKARRIESCPHTDQKGGSTIYPISNWPDRQLRGICTKCPIFIEPEHVEEDATGKRTLIPQHPLYHKVVERDIALYSDFTPTTGY